MLVLMSALAQAGGGEQSVELAYRIVAVPAEKFAAAPKEFEDAIRTFDQAESAARIAPYAEQLPRVSVKLDTKATIQVVRELRYPTAFETGGKGETIPAKFDTANLGATISAMAEWIDGRICVHGEVALVGLDGFTPGDAGIDMPSLTTKTAPYRCSMADGKTFGFWLPGFWMDTNAAGSFIERMTMNSVDRRHGALVSQRVGILVTARRLEDGLPLPSSPAATPRVSRAPAPGSVPPDGKPYATPVSGKSGFVISPFAPDDGYVDVRGFPSGSEVKDPYTGKYFLVP